MLNFFIIILACFLALTLALVLAKADPLISFSYNLRFCR